jgi:hypothetical protein
MPPDPRPSLRDLLLRSDFGRADPARVDALLRQPAPADAAPIPSEPHHASAD